MTNESCSERPRMCVSGSTSSMPRPMTSSITSRRDQRAERVEHRLRPGRHLLVLAAGQVAELLTADGEQRAEDDDPCGADAARALPRARRTARARTCRCRPARRVTRCRSPGRAAGRVRPAARRTGHAGRTPPGRRAPARTACPASPAPRALPFSEISTRPVWHGRSRASVQSGGRHVDPPSYSASTRLLPTRSARSCRSSRSIGKLGARYSSRSMPDRRRLDAHRHVLGDEGDVSAPRLAG